MAVVITVTLTNAYHSLILVFSGPVQPPAAKFYTGKMDVEIKLNSAVAVPQGSYTRSRNGQNSQTKRLTCYSIDSFKVQKIGKKCHTR